MASEKIKNVQSTPINLFRGTINSDICQDGNVYGYKYGKMAWLSGWVRIKSTASLGNNDVIVSGVPKAADNANVIYYDQNTSTYGCFYIVNGTTNITKSSYSVTEHLGKILNFACVYIWKD